MSCNKCNPCNNGIFGGNGDWIWIIIGIVVVLVLFNDNNGGILGDCDCNDRC